jgi:DNA replication and repair protein RecF
MSFIEGEGREHVVLGRLRLESFRNYAQLDLELGDGLHLVHGPNAQGKTNLLEAIHFLSTTRMLRGSRDAEAIMDGSSRALAEGDLGRTTVSIELEAGMRKKAKINGLGLPRASDLIGRLPSVCVSNQDLAIVSGEPADRRMFLDLELSQSYAAYLRHFTLYRRALDQRNALLKQANESFVSADNFEVWEVQLAEHGTAIRQMRAAFMQDLAPIATSVHSELGEGERLSVAFAPKDELELQGALQNTRAHDIQRKTTTIGPHRDDVRIEIEDREAKLFGSQGQQRSAMIALKLATLRHQGERLGKAPLLLLDDMLSDLDASRRDHLSEWVLEHAGQVVLTCTEKSLVSPEILKRAHHLAVRSGNVARE